MTSGGMVGDASAPRAKDVVTARVRALRSDRGWSTAALAGRCAELGAPELTANVIRNLESRARGVSVEQLLVFALALDVPPAYLLTPPEPGPVEARTPDNVPSESTPPEGIAVTDTITVTDPVLMNRWVSGTQPLEVTRRDLYGAAAAEHGTPTRTGPAEMASADIASRMLVQFEQQAGEFVDRVREDVTRLLDAAADDVASAEDSQGALAALQRARRRMANP